MSPEVSGPSSSNLLEVPGAQQAVEHPGDPFASETFPQAGPEKAYDEDHSDEPLFFSCPSTQERTQVPRSAKLSNRGTKDTLRMNERTDFDLDLDDFLDMSAFEDPIPSSPVKPGAGKDIRKYSPPLAKLEKDDKDSVTMPFLERETSLMPTVPMTQATSAKSSWFSEPSMFDLLAPSGVSNSTPSLLLPHTPFNTAPSRALETARTAEFPAQDLDLDDLEDWLMGGNVEIVD
jgi:hypothetical protein